MILTPAYALQTIPRGTDTSGFDVNVGVVIVFLLAFAMLAAIR